ncbi:TPA: hypothetical protein ACVU5P_004200 [Vibrio parahaemolyticus]
MNDPQTENNTKAHRTRFEYPEMESPLDARLKRAKKKEEHLKNNPSIYAMVIAGRLLVVCMLLAVCSVVIGGIGWVWYELAPYRATQNAKADAITIVEEAKARAVAQKTIKEGELDSANY